MFSLHNIIRTENVSKHFGKTKALSDLNLADGGSISGFVGPNGAGKTTAIHILMGFIKPNSGKATIYNLDCWEQSLEAKKRVGFLPEHPIYPGSLTGLRFVEHMARLCDVTDTKRSAGNALKEVGLAEAAEKPIKTYSAGMLQRLGLAQALVGEPELVIMDEPTANLDPTGRIDLLDKVKELNEDHGVSFFVSSHILPELEKICNWVSVIDHGTIVDQGYVKDLVDKHAAHTYKIVVSSPQKLVKILQTWESVENVWIEKDQVYAKIRKISKFMTEIPHVVALEKMKLRELRPLQCTFEEIYTDTVEGGQE